jgi:hypothetical protein
MLLIIRPVASIFCTRPSSPCFPACLPAWCRLPCYPHHRLATVHRALCAQPLIKLDEPGPLRAVLVALESCFALVSLDSIVPLSSSCLLPRCCLLETVKCLALLLVHSLFRDVLNSAYVYTMILNKMSPQFSINHSAFPSNVPYRVIERGKRGKRGKGGKGGKRCKR